MRYKKGTRELVSQGWNSWAIHEAREQGLVRQINKEILEPQGLVLVVHYGKSDGLPTGLTIENAEYLEQELPPEEVLIVIEEVSDFTEATQTAEQDEPIEEEQPVQESGWEKRTREGIAKILENLGQTYKRIDISRNSIEIVLDGRMKKRVPVILAVQNKYKVKVSFLVE